SEPRATQDVDIMSTRAAELAEELRSYLSDRFGIAVRIREIRDKGFRIYQTRKEGNRHLVDIRILERLPATRVIERINVLTPPELISSKVFSYESRRGKPKSGTDWRDLAVLLNRFPELKVKDGDVRRLLVERGASEFAIGFWNGLVDQDLSIEDDDSDLSF